MSLHNGLGCQLEPPDARDYLYEDILGSPASLPDNFVLDVPHFYQNGIDLCVGSACAAAKTVQEDVKISQRYAWHLAKKRQDYQGWGTSISHCMKGMIEEGALEYGTVNEDVENVDREQYMKPNITEDMKKIAKSLKIKSYWRAGFGERDLGQVMQALYTEQVPLVTSMMWYEEYNFPVKGFLPKPKKKAYGHAFILKGWKTGRSGRLVLIFQNSWQKNWGAKGDFYIYADEMADYQLGSFFVMTDIPSDKAKVLSRYKGQLVRNPDHPAHYHVNGKQIAWIKNEESFFYGKESGFWGRMGGNTGDYRHKLARYLRSCVLVVDKSTLDCGILRSLCATANSASEKQPETCATRIGKRKG